MHRRKGKRGPPPLDRQLAHTRGMHQGFQSDDTVVYARQLAHTRGMHHRSIDIDVHIARRQLAHTRGMHHTASAVQTVNPGPSTRTHARDASAPAYAPGLMEDRQLAHTRGMHRQNIQLSRRIFSYSVQGFPRIEAFSVSVDRLLCMGETALNPFPQSISRLASRIDRLVFIGGGTMTGTLFLFIMGDETPGGFLCARVSRS